MAPIIIINTNINNLLLRCLCKHTATPAASRLSAQYAAVPYFYCRAIASFIFSSLYKIVDCCSTSDINCDAAILRP